MTGRRPMRSLRSGVALVAVAVLAGWVVLVAVSVNLVVANRLNSEAEDLLRRVAQESAATVVFGSDGRITVPETTDDATLDVGTWLFHGDEIVQGPADSQSLDALAALLVDRGRTFEQTEGPDDIRWYAEPITVGNDQVGTVVTALSLAPYQTTGAYTLAGTAVLSVLLLAGAYLALRAGVGRALRPVEQMTEQAGQWSTEDVDRRFEDVRRPAELDRLANTLDGLLRRQSATVRNERLLSAEISHELRTPLARALAEVQLLRRAPGSATDTAQTLGAVEDSLGEMGSILETLMSTARLQGAGLRGRSDATTVVRDLAARQDSSPITVSVTSHGPAVVGVDAAVLARALSPVLDNALRHARSSVAIDVTGIRGSVLIEIRDDGTGIADDELPRIFEPGFRGQVPDGHSGAGLGLALAHRLIVAADGTVSARNENGAVVTVTLPAG